MTIFGPFLPKNLAKTNPTIGGELHRAEMQTEISEYGMAKSEREKECDENGGFKGNSR